MEMNVLHGLAMNLALRHSNAVENRERVLLDEGGELAVFDQLADILVGAAVRVLVVMVMHFAPVVVVVHLPMLVVMGRMFMPVLVAVGMRVLVLMRVLMTMVVVMVMAAAMIVIMPLTLIVMMVPMFVTVLMLMFMLMLMAMRMGMPVLVLVMMVPLAMLAVFLVLVVRVRGAFVNAKFHSLHLLPLLAVEVHVKIAEVELRELPLEGGRFHAEIDEGADSHVAGDAGKAVEEENFHREAGGE